MTRARTRGAGRTWNLPVWTAVVILAGLAAGLGPAEAAKGKSEAKKTESVGDADRSVEKAIAALEAGKTDLAVQELTSAVTGGKISQGKLAQALYYRGLAYRKQGKPAQAIADFTSALWIKNGLDAQQRNDALLNRAGAYRDAGLADQAEADEKRVAAAVKGGAPSARAATSEVKAQESAAQQTSSGSGLGGFFSALFGGSSTAQAPASQEFATSVAPASGRGAAGAQQVSSWSTETGPSTTAKSAGASSRPKPAAARQSAAGWEDGTVVRKVSARQTAATPATTGSTGKSSTHVQVAAVRSRQEAQAVTARLAQIGAAVPGKREAEVEEAVMGNMGTLYRVRLGPFASAAEVQSACPRLREAGFDCLVIGH